MKEKFTSKNIIVALLLIAIAFVSFKYVSDYATSVEDTFAESITQTYDNADELSGEAEKATAEEDKSGFMSFLENIGDEVTGLADNAKNALSVFIDAIAVMLITTCVIPILVILFFLWLIKMIFGLNIDTSRATKWMTKKVLKV